MRAHPVLDVLAARRAEGSCPSNRTDPHRVALAVEGGGSRATYSSGMVLALEELGLAPCFDAVYGSSAGALAGSWLVGAQAALCTAGWYRPGLMERVTNPGRGLRGKPVVDVEYLVHTVGEKVIPFDWQAVLDAQVPLHPVATDVETGEAVDLADTIVDKASLQLALRASAAVPLLAGLPVEIEGRRYVDAAVAEPIPFRTALAQGATHVLVLRTRRADQTASTPPAWRRRWSPASARSTSRGSCTSMGNRLENRRADDSRLAHATASPTDEPPYLFEVRPPSGADTINPLETDPDVLRKGIETRAGRPAPRPRARRRRPGQSGRGALLRLSGGPQRQPRDDPRRVGPRLPHPPRRGVAVQMQHGLRHQGVADDHRAVGPDAHAHLEPRLARRVPGEGVAPGPDRRQDRRGDALLLGARAHLTHHGGRGVVVHGDQHRGRGRVSQPRSSSPVDAAVAAGPAQDGHPGQRRPRPPPRHDAA